MKKIFTFAAMAALALSSYAADGFKVTAKGAEGEIEITNGADLTIECGEYEVWIDDENEEWNSYILTIDPKIQVTSEKGGDYTTVIKNLADVDLQWCGFGTITCTMIETGATSQRNATLQANVPMNMVLDYAPRLTGPLTDGASYSIPFEMTVSESRNPSNVVSAKITMTYTYKEESGVKEVGADNVKFNVVGGKVVSNGEVEVYNLQGQKVTNENLHGIFVVKAGNKTAKLFVK